jgi:hypothetical protein
MAVTVGPGSASVSGPLPTSQTGSVFAATRSIAFAGDRIVVAFQTGPSAKPGWKLVSIDQATGQIKDSREFPDFGLRGIFATSDAHVIVSGTSLLRLTPELKDDGELEVSSSEHPHGRVENISPDGSTLGLATNPGYELIDARTLKAARITTAPSVDTSVNSKGFITDNVHWTNDYPKDLGFVTFTDAQGTYLVYHGKCGGRPQFLSDESVFEPGCKAPLILDSQGNVLHTLPVRGAFSFAGVSQDGKRLALQTGATSAGRAASQERFAIYSVLDGKPIAEITSTAGVQSQSWSAFSPDGALFAIGSADRLTLYRLP